MRPKHESVPGRALPIVLETGGIRRAFVSYMTGVAFVAPSVTQSVRRFSNGTKLEVAGTRQAARALEPGS
jgi:hypothetical protein